MKLTIWITKTLKDPIVKVVDAEIRSDFGIAFYTDSTGKQIMVNGEGKNWHLSLNQAISRIEFLRERKVTDYLNKIESIKELKIITLD